MVKTIEPRRRDLAKNSGAGARKENKEKQSRSLRLGGEDRPEDDRRMRVEDIWIALDEVKDPEIPVVSVVEMGIIHDVQIEDDRVTIEMTPTFVGCPALDVMRAAMRERIVALGAREVNVRLTFAPPWNSDRITPGGRQKLKDFGFAPPPSGVGTLERSNVSTHNLIQIQFAACPHCDSTDTTLESPFGPTLCRAIHYCNSCQQSFEQFKPL